MARHWTSVVPDGLRGKVGDTNKNILIIWPATHAWSIIIWPFLSTPDRLVIVSQARSQPFMMTLARSCQRRKKQDPACETITKVCFSMGTWRGVKSAVWGLSGGVNQLILCGETSSIFLKSALRAYYSTPDEKYRCVG